MSYKKIISCAIVAGALVTLILWSGLKQNITPWQMPDNRLRLDQISFLGAHNACISKLDGWVYHQQFLTLIDMLNNGVRAFEFDLAMENKQLHICHGDCKSLSGRLQKIGPYATFKQKIQIVSEWLNNNPREVAIITLDNQRDKTMPANITDQEIDSLPNVIELILTREDWNPDDHDGMWPTLSWMQEKNKRLVILNEKKDDSPMYTYYQWRYVMCTLPGESIPEYSCRIRKDSLENNQFPHYLYQLNHGSALSNDFLTSAYKIGKTLGITGKGRILPDHKLQRSDNKRSTILKVVEYCKEKDIAGKKNPNLLMLDHLHKFLNDNGLALINEWNKQAAQALIPTE